MNRDVARVWRIKVTMAEAPVYPPPIESRYKYWVFVDRTGTMTRNMIHTHFWHTFQKDMFDRPEVEVTYLTANDEIELTAIQLAEAFHSKKTMPGVFVKILK